MLPQSTQRKGSRPHHSSQGHLGKHPQRQDWSGAGEGRGRRGKGLQHARLERNGPGRGRSQEGQDWTSPVISAGSGLHGWAPASRVWDGSDLGREIVSRTTGASYKQFGESVGSLVVGLHIKDPLTGKCVLSLGTGQPWEGQSLLGSTGPQEIKAS